VISTTDLAGNVAQGAANVSVDVLSLNWQAYSPASDPGTPPSGAAANADLAGTSSTAAQPVPIVKIYPEQTSPTDGSSTRGFVFATATLPAPIANVPVYFGVYNFQRATNPNYVGGRTKAMVQLNVDPRSVSGGRQTVTFSLPASSSLFVGAWLLFESDKDQPLPLIAGDQTEDVQIKSLVANPGGATVAVTVSFGEPHRGLIAISWANRGEPLAQPPAWVPAAAGAVAWYQVSSDVNGVARARFQVTPEAGDSCVVLATTNQSDEAKWTQNAADAGPRVIPVTTSNGVPVVPPSFFNWGSLLPHTVWSGDTGQLAKNGKVIRPKAPTVLQVWRTLNVELDHMVSPT